LIRLVALFFSKVRQTILEKMLNMACRSL